MAGEEHYMGWGSKVCGPEGGPPSLSALTKLFEDETNNAADAAGVPIPAVVVAALTYYVAVSTLAPPTGAPSISECSLEFCFII